MNHFFKGPIFYPLSGFYFLNLDPFEASSHNHPTAKWSKQKKDGTLKFLVEFFYRLERLRKHWYNEFGIIWDLLNHIFHYCSLRLNSWFCAACLMFTSVSSPPSQMGNEEQQERLLREWLDCCVTEGGVLVALQKSSRRRNHPLVTQMVEKWLDGYRQIRPCASLSDGEEEEDDDDE